MFGANVHHVPRLCLLGIGGAPTLVIKLWPKNQIFTFLTSSLKPPADGASYYATYRHFGRTLKIVKCKNLVFVYKTFENLLLQNYSKLTKFLDITYK